MARLSPLGASEALLAPKYGFQSLLSARILCVIPE
jgi:hypothetical protein